MKLSKNLTTVTTLSKVLAVALYFVVMMIGFFLGVQYQKSQVTSQIDSYEECVEAGGRVAEKYPPTCYLDDGRSFDSDAPAPVIID